MQVIPPYLIATVPESPHIGEYFMRASPELGVETVLADVRGASLAPRWVSRLYWHLLDKKPPSARKFRETVVASQTATSAGAFVATGLSGTDARTLSWLGTRGVLRANFTTDDPWNPLNGARWFFRALREYDVIFTPRRANIADFNRLGCRRVEYLPFAYEPSVHFPEPLEADNRARFDCDVAFVGGGDRDRLPYVDALREAGLSVRVYGAGWPQYPRWRAQWGGEVFGHDYRQAVAGARVQLCLVRRANRDGHVMRSFELPAMRSCILAEDTEEHRAIYGAPHEARVAYFADERGAVSQAKRLLADDSLRERMAKSVFAHVVETSPNTYRDRFAHIVTILEAERARRAAKA